MLKSITKLLGGSNDGVLKKMRSTVDEINDLEADFQALSDNQLRATKDEFKARLDEGEELDDLLPEAFAAVREAAKRALGMRHFDVQLIGGIVLHEGRIAEMRTGEGKTLAATLPAYLNALAGRGVHVVTVNDYLARRDAQWMAQVYDLLGISVGVLQHDSAHIYDPEAETSERGMERLRRVERREAYRADITYGTNNEFGFDYLRDNMVVDLEQRVQPDLAYAIVDEVDNILIDEARTPLIISGPAEQSPKEYQKFARLVPSLRPLDDFTLDEKHRSVALTNDGISKLERLLNVKNVYDASNYEQVHFIENALKAHVVYLRDREYVVQDGEVIIVDEFTGRLMHGRRFSDGLHQALEAKEGVSVQRESVTYATITLQNYFRLYGKLAGMTGTAATEAEEFWKIYKLDVVEIPTNMPMVRDDKRDLIYKDQNSKYQAVVNEIKEHSSLGQPVLVGTTDIDKSEMLSERLKREGVLHEVLNAKQHEREAAIVAQAGRPGAVTVATNMAGRGTDIILGGNPDTLDIPQKDWQADHDKVVEQGGLYIIGTERHEARRIDNQLRGRSGRQGDPGTTRFYVALDDELMRRFGGETIKRFMDWALEDDVPIESRAISKAIEGAQVKTEAHHFDMRKHLVEYDDVINTHRDVIYQERDKILTGADLKFNIQSMVEDAIREILGYYLADGSSDNWDTESLLAELAGIHPISPELSDPEQLALLSVEEIEDGIIEHSEALYEGMESSVTPNTMRIVERQLMLRIMDSDWVQHLTSMENLRQGIGLHAYGQRDPLVMYKKEGHELFQSFQARIQHDIVHSVYHVAGVMPNGSANGESQRKPPRASKKNDSVMTKVVGDRNREAVSDGRKVGRNDACPCGSGKKYKRCHGT